MCRQQSDDGFSDALLPQKIRRILQLMATRQTNRNLNVMRVRRSGAACMIYNNDMETIMDSSVMEQTRMISYTVW